MHLEERIALARAGDIASYSEIYRQYAVGILRYLYARLGDQELAQELTQEVFVRALHNLGVFESRGELLFLGWLYQIAGDVLAGYAQHAAQPRTPLDGGSELPSQPGLDRSTLRRMLLRLPEQQQVLLALRFFAGMSASEIAQALRIAEPAVLERQHQALAALHQLIEQGEQAPHAAVSGPPDPYRVPDGPLQGRALDSTIDIMEYRRSGKSAQHDS